MKTNTPARIILIVALSIICTTGYMKVTEAAPSRKEIICQKSFIGYEYNPRLEKRCRGLWTQWNQKILVSFNQ